MKKAFSLLELIFAIVVIGIIASFAIPKYLDTKDNALASTIKRDLVTVITSVQNYYLINQEIEKVSDAVSISSTNWQIEDKKMIFMDKDKECLILEVIDSKIEVKINTDIQSNVCKILEEDMGIKDETFDLI